MSVETKLMNDQQQFIKLMKSRDLGALEILYDHYSSVLYGVIFRIMNDEQQSEKVLFKTFTDIWNHFETFDDSVNNICLWMVNIARKCCFEILKPETRLHRMVEWNKSLAELMHEEQFNVLNAAFFEETSLDKIANKFGYTETKVRTLLREATEILKKDYMTG